MESGGAGATPEAGEWQPRYNAWLVAVSVMLGTFMEVLDTSVANVALPHIAGSLSATPSEATWVLTSYLVSNAIILPASAWLSSYFGRKRFLMACILIFTTASAVCGAALSLGMLVAARVVQGAGGGALQPIAQAILMESFPPARRGAAMAAYSMGVIVAPILGPTFGGWITDNYSWRWVFYINLPVGALALLMTQTFIEDPPYIRRVERGRIDYVGFGLMAVGLSTLQVILDKGQEDDWFSAVWIRWFAVISVITLLAFVVRELLVDHPIVDLRILRDRNFAVGTLMAVAVGVGLYGTTVQLPLFLQTLLDYPAMQSGLALSPRGVGAMCAAIVVGRLIGFIDGRVLIAAGFVLFGFSALLYSHMTLAISLWSVAFVSLVNGISTGLIFVPLSTTTLGRLRNEQMGGATGIYNLMRNIGGSVGISLVTTLLARAAQVHQNVLVQHLTPYDPMYLRKLQALRAGLARQTDPVTASRQALGVVYNVLVQQATLLAFADNFRSLSFLGLACAPLTAFFARVMPRRIGGAH
jgi:DHA2 family multidrug resistance protein